MNRQDREHQRFEITRLSLENREFKERIKSLERWTVVTIEEWKNYRKAMMEQVEDLKVVVKMLEIMVKENRKPTLGDIMMIREEGE